MRKDSITYPSLKLAMLLILLMVTSVTFAILPDILTLSIPDVTGDDNDDHIVLTKRPLRKPGMKVYEFDGPNYTQTAVPEVGTYRGHVQEDKRCRHDA